MALPPLTKDELLDIWRTLFPASFTAPIEEEAGGQGRDIFDQQAAQLTRAAAAVDTTTQAYYLKPHSTQTAPEAAGARRATGEVEISRVPPLAGDIVLSAGTELQSEQRDSRGGVVVGPRFRLTEDVTLPAGSLGPVTAQIEASRVGYQGNLPIGRIEAFALRGRATVTAQVTGPNEIRDLGVPDRFSAGMLGQFVRFLTGDNADTFPRRITGVTQGSVTIIVLDGPPLVVPILVPISETVDVLEFADLGLTIEQLTETSGGRHGFLDAIGFDRRARRVPGESDSDYRDRLCFLDDVVSPAAILRIAARILTPKGIGFELKETRDPLGIRGFVLDVDALDLGSLSNGAILVNDTTAVRYFVLCVGLSGLGEFGFPLDATVNLPTPSANALDVGGGMDGFATIYAACLRQLYEAVEAARAAGVAWDLVQDPTL